MTPPRKRGTRFRNFLIVLISAFAGVAATALALELGIRMLHPYLSRDLKIVWIRSHVMRRVHRLHRDLLWMPLPSFKLAYPDARFSWRLNHVPYPNDPTVGYRADDAARPPVDLVVIGDSYTYGFEVDQDKTWVEVLKRSMGISAVNLAVTSYGTSQEAQIYQRFGEPFHPKAVIQVIVPNDPLDNIFFNEVNARKDFRVVNLCWFLRLRQPSLACSATLWIVNHSIAGGIAVFELQALAKRRGAEDPEMKRGTEMICGDIKRVQALARGRGAEYGAVFIGLWKTPRLKGLKDRLDACVKENAVTAITLDEHREALRRGRRFTGRFDWHWNDEGHAYVAARIEEFLRAQGWLKLIDRRGGRS